MPEPAVRPALSRVGLTGVEAVVRLGVSERSAQPFAARIECMLEPDPRVGGRSALRGHRDRRASRGRRRRPRRCAPSASRASSPSGCASARVRAGRRWRSPRASPSAGRRPCPAPRRRRSPRSTPERSPPARGTRRTVGVSAQGITAAPHAQAVLAARVARAARGRGLRAGADRARARAHPRRHPRPARHRHAAPRLPRGGVRSSSTSRRCWTSSRARCRARSSSS